MFLGERQLCHTKQRRGYHDDKQGKHDGGASDRGKAEGQEGEAGYVHKGSRCGGRVVGALRGADRVREGQPLDQQGGGDGQRAPNQHGEAGGKTGWFGTQARCGSEGRQEGTQAQGGGAEGRQEGTEAQGRQEGTQAQGRGAQGQHRPGQAGG